MASPTNSRLDGDDGLSRKLQKGIVGIRQGDLPLWVLVQYACRCARRVSCLYFGPDKATISEAIEIAEAAAASATPAKRDPSVDRLWKFYELEARLAGGIKLTESYYAAAAAFSAYVAATSAAAALTCAQDAAEQAWRAHLAWDLATPASKERAHAALVDDLNLLKQLAKHEKWNDTTPVPANLLPPLALDRAVSAGAAGLSTLAFWIDTRSSGSRIKMNLVIAGGTRSARSEMGTRIRSDIRKLLRAFCAEEAPTLGVPALAPDPRSSDLLHEKSFKLLRMLGHFHCTVDLITWVGGFLNKSNAYRYIEELTARGLIVRDAHKRYAITKKGQQHLLAHSQPLQPRSNPPATKS